MIKEKRPCPFCGSTKLEVSERYGAPGCYLTVNCLNLTCEAIGPRGEDDAAAVAAWNRAIR
ncbi:MULTISPECIES: Lar family restriction alleviation protein [Methylobacterium]